MIGKKKKTYVIVSDNVYNIRIVGTVEKLETSPNFKITLLICDTYHVTSSLYFPYFQLSGDFLVTKQTTTAGLPCTKVRTYLQLKKNIFYTEYPVGVRLMG